MNNQELSQTMIKLYNKGLISFNNGDKKALKLLYSSYKIAKKLNNIHHCEKCAELLNYICFSLANVYYSRGKNYYYDDAYSRASIALKKAKKLAKLGNYFEDYLKTNNNNDLLNSIEELILDNKDHLIERRQERFEEIKDNITDFIDNLFDSLSSSPSEEEEKLKDPQNIAKAHEEHCSLYNKGIEANNRETKLDYFKESYYIAKKYNLSDDKYDAAYKIAEIYMDYGCDKFNEGIQYYNDENYHSSKSCFREAESYYRTALEWSPSETLDKSIESDIYDCIHEYTEADYEID